MEIGKSIGTEELQNKKKVKSQRRGGIRTLPFILGQYYYSFFLLISVFKQTHSHYFVIPSTFIKYFIHSNHFNYRIEC